MKVRINKRYKAGYIEIIVKPNKLVVLVIPRHDAIITATRQEANEVFQKCRAVHTADDGPFEVFAGHAIANTLGMEVVKNGKRLSSNHCIRHRADLQG